jgi:hypothetical protein
MRSNAMYAMVVAMTVLVSCGRPVVTGRSGGRAAAPTGPGTGPIIAAEPLPNDFDGPRSADRAISRTVCKLAGFPRGFVAVNYIQSKDCMQTRDSTKVLNAAVLVDITKRPFGTLLLVCADQPTPGGWSPTGIEKQSSACPREPSDKSTRPTVVEIQKTAAR